MSLQSQAAAARDAVLSDMAEAAAVARALIVAAEATTLSANILAGGSGITSIPITPNLAGAITAGTNIAVGGELFVASGTNSSGASSITVTSQVPARAHFIGELISPPSVFNHALRAILATAVQNTPDAYRARFAWACATQGDVPSRIVTDGATTNGSPNVTSATANFTATDQGSPISGTGIPAASTILTVTSSTQVVISANATATGSALSLTIGTPDATIQAHVSSAWNVIAGA